MSDLCILSHISVKRLRLKMTPCWLMFVYSQEHFPPLCKFLGKFIIVTASAARKALESEGGREWSVGVCAERASPQVSAECRPSLSRRSLRLSCQWDGGRRRLRQDRESCDEIARSIHIQRPSRPRPSAPACLVAAAWVISFHCIAKVGSS